MRGRRFNSSPGHHLDDASVRGATTAVSGSRLDARQGMTLGLRLDVHALPQPDQFFERRNLSGVHHI